MNSSIFVFGLFALAFVVSLYQIAGTIQKKGFRAVDNYTLNMFCVFLYLAVWKIPDVFDLILPYAVHIAFSVIFIILGIKAAYRLSKIVNTRPPFKLYKNDLFVVIFATVVLISSLPY